MGTYLALFFSSFIVALSGAMMPGPLLTINISESTVRGSMTGPLLILGHGLLELALLIALILGLAPFLTNPTFFILVALIGGAIMLWMAYSMFRSIPSLSLVVSETNKPRRNLIVSGVLMSISNPYWIIWWSTIGIGYIFQSMEKGMIGLLLFYLGHILGDLVWYSSISFAIGRGKSLFTTTTYRLLIAICATFLVLYSLFLIYSGVKKI